MEYVCRVGTPSGEVEERTFQAADEAALRADLESQGYYLFSARRNLGLGDWRLRRRRVPATLLMVFSQELAALLKAGLPLLQCLDVMLERQRDPLFRRSLDSVRERVRSGWALSEAFRSEGTLYPPIFAASLVAGERSGSLEPVLRRFVEYLRLNQSLKKKAISATVYPGILFALMIGVVSLLLVKVIPEFQGFYQGLGAELPLPTRVLMAVAVAIRANLLPIVVTLVVGIGVAWAWLGREGSGAALDRFLLRLPMVGDMMRMYATSQLARTLATLLAGGLPLLNALEVAASSVGNRAVASAVALATPQIREGRSLTAALESTGVFEDMTLEMIKVGEQTGALGEMLSTVSQFHDEELETRLATALALVEPVMLILMAVIVAAMLLAFYLPMFQALSAIQGTAR